MKLDLTQIHVGAREYPVALAATLGAAAPTSLAALGDPAILASRKLALFCSNRCPGDLILKAYDLAKKLRDAGVTVISGFHSPVEKECLRILLRGKQPIVICPARSLERFRIPAAWKPALDSGRLVIVSPFANEFRRATADLAQRRNEFVAALADEIVVIHASPGGRLDEQVAWWKLAGRKVTLLDSAIC